MKYYKNVINAILGKYIILTFILIGITFAVIGMFAFNETSKLGIIFTNLGSVIIGGGFFSALTKTKHYTDFFQNRIFDVFFNPARHISNDILKEKWIILTKSLLKNVTNIFHDGAANEIYDRYLSLESDYHYADMTVTFDIELKDNIIFAKQIITNKAIANITTEEIIIKNIFSPDKDKDDYVDLKEFYLNGRKDSNCFKSILNKDSGEKTVEITINTVTKKEHEIERHLEFKQNIQTDPVISVEYSKFIKGLTVKYKGKNCLIHFLPMGKNNFACSNIEKEIDANGYTRVVISEPDKLTLPWQGVTLFITPINRGN